MKIDPNPLFRKAVAPWYDSNATCWILLAVLAGIALFSAVGIEVARTRPDYQNHAWVPIALLVLCLLAAGSIAYRLVMRRYDQRLQDKEL